MHPVSIPGGTLSSPRRSYAPTLVKRISRDLRGASFLPKAQQSLNESFANSDKTTPAPMVGPSARTFADAVFKIGTVEIEICLRNIVNDFASPPSERR